MMNITNLGSFDSLGLSLYEESSIGIKIICCNRKRLVLITDPLVIYIQL